MRESTLAPPKPRTLRLTTPYTSGPDVAEVQRALGVEPDGAYGPVTAGAVVAWKRERGYPDGQLSPELRPLDRRRLLGQEPLPPAFERRARERVGEAAHGRAAREAAVRTMEGWAAAGLRERPPGSNRVPELAALARQLGVAPAFREMGFPWCAFAAFLAALEAGGTTADLGLRRSSFNPLYAPAVLAEAQAGRSGLRLVSEGRTERGDLVLFDWGSGGDPADHVARLVRPPAGGLVVTVDGNTDDAGVVAVAERPLASVRAFARDS